MSKHWQRNFRAIWAAELLAIMGFAAFTPILPYYVQLLGVRGAAVNTWAGAVAAAPALAMAVVAPIWGALSDRYGRKLMVERAMFSGAILTLLMALARTVEQLTLLRLLQGALTGTIAAATTLVASGTPQYRLGETLGRLQLAIFLGQSLGPMVGGFVGDQLGYRAVFWLTSACLSGGGLIILWLVHEEFTPAAENAPGSFVQRLGKDFGVIFASGMLALVLGLRFGLRVGLQTATPLMPLLVQELLPPNALLGSASGLLVTVSGLSSAVAAPVLGRMADRRGGRAITLLCGLAAGVALVFQAFAADYQQLLIWQLLIGVGIGGTLATISAYIGRLAPEGKAGVAYGLDSTAVSLANSIGPFTGGWLARWFDLRVSLAVGGALMLLASLGVLRLPKDEKK